MSHLGKEFKSIIVLCNESMFVYDIEVSQEQFQEAIDVLYSNISRKDRPTYGHGTVQILPEDEAPSSMYMYKLSNVEQTIVYLPNGDDIVFLDDDDVVEVI